MFVTNGKEDLRANTADKILNWDYTTLFPHYCSRAQTGAAPYVHGKRFTLSSSDTAVMGAGHQH